MNTLKEQYIAEGAIVKGNVKLGKDASVWYHATIRGDSNSITIGDETNIQDNVVVHTENTHPVTIGNGVTIGHSAVVHGCMIGDNSLIGMGAIVLNGADIGKDCIIGDTEYPYTGWKPGFWQPCKSHPPGHRRRKGSKQSQCLEVCE